MKNLFTTTPTALFAHTIIAPKHNRLVTALVLLAFGLTGCQSTPHSARVTLASLNLKQLSPTSSASAHKLMQSAMLHRFDKSYIFDRITQYQALPLYNDQDIEVRQDSVFNLLFNEFYGRGSDNKPRHLSKEQLACEDSYNTALDKTLDDFNDDVLDDTQVTQQQAEQQATYERCMANAPEYIDAKKIDQKKPSTAQAQTLKDDVDSKEDEDKEVTITDDKPQARRRADFQEVMKKSIEKLDNLEARQAKAQKRQAKSRGYSRGRFGMARMLGNLTITPEQIDVVNQSFLQNQTLRYSGFYDQKNGHFSTVVEENRQRLGVENYRRVPVLLDLHEMSITLEPEVGLPFAAIMFDKQLPENIVGKSVKFTLPANLKQNIPLPLLKDSLTAAIGRAYGDIDAEKFNEVVHDDYARSLHASRVVKINMGVQEMSFLFARSVKYWVADLNQIASQHPEYIQNNQDFKLALELMTKLNRHYRADDVAHLAKIIEAFLPVSFNGYNYYYFDNQNNLIGYRKSRDYSSGLVNGKLVATTVNKITYQPITTFDKSQIRQFYQPNANDTIDGNALIDNLINDKKLEAVARDARFEYDMSTDSTALTAHCQVLNQRYTKLTATATAQPAQKIAELEATIASDCHPLSPASDTQTDGEASQAPHDRIAENDAAKAAPDIDSEESSEDTTDLEDNESDESDYQKGSNRSPRYHLSADMQSDE